MSAAGDVRPPSGIATCAEIACDLDADVEAFHRPSDEATWVPLCDRHYAEAPVVGLEYIVERHGFISPTTEATS